MEQMKRDSGIPAPAPGDIMTDGRNFLAIATADGALSVTELQVSGKKRMGIREFLLGFRDPASYTTSRGTSSQITGKHA